MSSIKIAKKVITNLPAIRYEYKLPVHSNVSCENQIAKLPDYKVSAQVLNSLFTSEKIAAKTSLTLRETKQQVPAYITKFEKENTIHLYIKNEQADKLGYASLAYPAGGFCKTPIGEDYIYNSMSLIALESKNNACKASPYRGIGSELLKAAVRESQKLGFGGRIHLMAYDAKPPIVFYYKNGLRFLNNEKDVLMQKYLNTPKEIRGEIPQELQSGMMYLPDENIAKLLAL